MEALALLAMIGSIGGQAISGAAGAKESAADRMLRQYLAERQMQSGETALADMLRGKAEALPVRDKALYAIQQRLGLTPGEFKPRDIFNPQLNPSGIPQQGGYDLGAFKEAMSAYTPGAGGTRPELLDQLINRTLGAGGGASGRGAMAGPGGQYSFPMTPERMKMIEALSGRPKGPWGPQMGGDVPRTSDELSRVSDEVLRKWYEQLTGGR